MLLLALSTALAGAGGLQGRLYPGALQVAEALVSDQTFEVARDDVGAAYDCWDRIGVRDLSLTVPVETVELGLEDGELAVWIQFGDIEGEDWTLYAEDEEWTDSCPEFETAVTYVKLSGAALTARIALDVDDGVLQVETVGTPEIIGDLDSDIETFPDDLVLAFYEEEVMNTLAEALGDLVPELVDGYLSDALLGGQVGEFSLSFEPVSAGVTEDALKLSANGAAAWSGDDGCAPVDRIENTGRAPALDFDDPGDADLAVGLTESLATELVQGLWADGWFCFTEDNLSEFLDLVADAFDPSLGELTATAALSEPPDVVIDRDGLALGLSGAEIHVRGGDEPLLDATLDLSGALELSVDPAVGAFTLSLHDLHVDITSFEADHLLSGDDAADDLERFLEQWATGWVEDQTQDLVLFSTLYRLYGLVIRVDQITFEDGGLTIYLSLFEEDDPDVDSEAPDTDVAVTRGEGGADVAWSGTDDRAGALAFMWRLDDGTWSSWTADAGVALTDLSPGSHTVEVVARDAWWNTDPSPAAKTFDVEALPEPDVEEKGRGCGCGSGGGPGLLAVGLALLALRRRQLPSPV